MAVIQDTLSGKMYPERSAATSDKILEPCLKKSHRPKFQCLNLEDGQTLEWLEGMGIVLRGESLTRNIGASPSVAVESSLLQILEDKVLEKYFLSAKACQGILRRAEKRGKKLPPVLEMALMAQASPSQNGKRWREGATFTLDTTGNNAVAHAVEPYPNPANSLLAKANMSFRSDTDNIVRVGYAVRRLTPLECERLMGFPDDWLDIDGMSDTQKYKAIGNSLAVPCVEFIMQRIKDVKK